MKILISASGVFPEVFGGGRVYVYNLAKQLMCKRHNAAVLTNGPFSSDRGSYSINIHIYKEIPVASFSLNQEVLSYSRSEKTVRHVKLR